MRKLLRQHEEWYIAGQCCALVGNEVRAPLTVLYKIHGDCEVHTLARRTSDGRWWHAMRFGTQRGAAEFFDRLKARYPHGLKTYEYMLRCMGGRLP